MGIEPEGDVNLDAFYSASAKINDKESGEAEEPDTSDEIDEKAGESEESEDELDEEEESDDDDEEDDPDDDDDEEDEKIDYKAKYEDAEEKRRSFQRRADRAETQMSLLKTELDGVKSSVVELKTGIQDNETNELLSQIDDNGLVEGKVVKELYKKATKQAKVQPKQQQVDTGRFNEWVLSHDDTDDINDLYTSERSLAENRMASIPTDDPVGRYQELRLMHRERQIAKLEKQLKKSEKARKSLKKSKSKPRVPMTGPGGRNVSTSKDGEGNQPGFTLDRFFRS